jgi:hypothetical protein
MLSEGLTALESNISNADSKEDEEVKKFSAQVNEDCPKVLKRIAECREQLDTGFLADPDTADEKSIKFLGMYIYGYVYMNLNMCVIHICMYVISIKYIFFNLCVYTCMCITLHMIH